MSEPQQRLAQAVRDRRLKLGLSVRAAAKKAGVDRNTWMSVEDGSRTLQDRNYAKFEHALDWPDGAIEARLNEDSSPGPKHEWSAAERARMLDMSDAEVQEIYEDFRRHSEYIASVWMREVTRVRDEAKQPKTTTES
jgi:transcriptional regulator with XRE-family HTH domain